MKYCVISNNVYFRQQHTLRLLNELRKMPALFALMHESTAVSSIAASLLEVPADLPPSCSPCSDAVAIISISIIISIISAVFAIVIIVAVAVWVSLLVHTVSISSSIIV